VSAKSVRRLRKKSHLTRLPPGIPASEGPAHITEIERLETAKEKNHDI
jgi:hypothetical protein